MYAYFDDAKVGTVVSVDLSVVLARLTASRFHELSSLLLDSQLIDPRCQNGLKFPPPNHGL